MSKEKNNMMVYVHWVIGFAIMCSGYVFPVSEPLTPLGARVLMIFIGLVYMWCTVNPIGSSLLALVMVTVVGYAPFTKVLAGAISNNVWSTCFFALIFMVATTEAGVPKYISHAIFKASQNIVTGRPMMLIFILMVAAFIISTLVGIIATILIFWAICYAIVDDLKIQKRDPYSMLLVMSCFMGAMLGNTTLPFSGATLIILSAFEAASGLKVPYGTFILLNTICSMIIIVIYCLAIKYVTRIDLSSVKNIDGKVLIQEELPPMDLGVKANLFALIMFVSTIMASSFMPKEWAITAFLNDLGVPGISIILLIFLFVIQGSSNAAIKVGRVMSQVPWPAVFMVLAAAYMANVMKDKEATGIIPWLKMVMTPVLGGHSEFVFMLICLLLALVLTCFFHNGALGNMMMPVMVAIASSSGYHMIAIAVIMTLGINVAFLAPSASNYAPFLHGNTEYITVKDIWTYGLFFELLCCAVFIFIGFPLAKMMM